MLSLLAALGLCLATWKILQGGWRGQSGLQVAGLEASSGVLAVLALAAAMYFWGVLYGIALIVAVLVHEFGHVAAYRVCGHADARFRLIPLMGGVAISNSAPARADEEFFITLMGPAINLAPMALCLAAAEVIFTARFTTELPYQLGSYLFVQGMVLAALNFFNLLPLWPLDGGRMTQRLIYTFAPSLTRQVSIAMMLLAVGLCLLTQSLFLLFFVLMSWPSLMQAESRLATLSPLPPKRALLALAAYLATAAAFFAGGHPLFLGLI